MQELWEKIKPLIKLIIVVGIIVLIGWGVKRGVNHLFKDATEDTTYPAAPRETASLFFNHIQAEQYQDCYGLLSPNRKAAAVIGKQNREKYFQHFSRIRNYLIRQIGPDFTSVIAIDDTGEKVSFDNYVVLTLAFQPKSSLDSKTHYPLDQINEFPIDIAPGIGIEQYNRRMGRALENIGSIGSGEDNLDDPAEIIKDRDESPSRRLERLIYAFNNAPQLDTRQTVLEWIIKEFPNAPKAQAFFDKLSRDETLSPNLRQIAQNAL